MENLIPDNIQVVDRPIVSGRSKFPYEAVLKTLRVIDSTKSVIMKEKEINPNNLSYLRTLVENELDMRLRYCKKDGCVYIWINK